MDGLTALALAAGSGDVDALDGLVEAAYDQVWRLCAGLVDAQSADDLAQDAFVRAVRALPSFAGRSSARTWLLSIARHTCLDDLRSRQRRRRLDGPLPDAAFRPDASEHLALHDLLSQLQPERRAAFVLTQLLGLSYREAAEVCGCPEGTIRSRLARGRAQLLDLLDSARHAGEADAAPC